MTLKMAVLVGISFLIAAALGDILLSQDQNTEFSVVTPRIVPSTGEFENCADALGDFQFEVCYPIKALSYKETTIRFKFPAESNQLRKISVTSQRRISGIIGWSGIKPDGRATLELPIARTSYDITYTLPQLLQRTSPNSSEKFVELEAVIEETNGHQGKVKLKVPIK